MATQWTIAIDWDRDGNFTGTYDDVTEKVVSAAWALGIMTAYQEAADAATLKLELKNADRHFSPEYSGSPLYGNLVPQRPVRIQSDDGTTVRTHWQGWLSTIQPAVGQYGERTATITATGAMQFLKAAETSIELQEDKRTDEIIQELIEQVTFPPALNRAWRLGYSKLGVDTYLPDLDAPYDFETGTITLEMAAGQMSADDWVRQGGLSDVKQDTFNVYHAIRDIFLPTTQNVYSI